jgi:hypothetical protein
LSKAQSEIKSKNWLDMKRGFIIFLIIFFVVFMAKKLLPRGIRNNNPGNLRKMGNWQAWYGALPPAEQTDKDFIIFDTPQNGLRAMARTIINYFGRGIYDGTVYEIISKYAPKTENDTLAYVTTVCRKTGLTASETVDTKEELALLLSAMVEVENAGLQPFTQKEYYQAIDRALVML